MHGRSDMGMLAVVLNALPLWAIFCIICYVTFLIVLSSKTLCKRISCQMMCQNPSQIRNQIDFRTSKYVRKPTVCPNFPTWHINTHQTLAFPCTVSLRGSCGPWSSARCFPSRWRTPSPASSGGRSEGGSYLLSMTHLSESLSAYRSPGKLRPQEQPIGLKHTFKVICQEITVINISKQTNIW